MKKSIIFLALSTIAFVACKDDEPTIVQEPSIETQNAYDNEAAQKFLQENYLDEKGNIRTFSTSDDSDDEFPKLADLNPVTLPSGVIYIIREGAQPEAGTAVGDKDSIQLFQNTVTYVATNTDNKVSFNSPSTFRNSIDGSGIPDNAPWYYYVPSSVLEGATGDAAKQRSFYEIEGLREALPHFTAFNKTNEEDYNLQGVIIVPSRAAFARDVHYNYTGLAFRNRSFVFNFQIYRTFPRVNP